MLMVAPSGSINLVTRLSTLLFSSKHRKVIGSVAELEAVPTAVNHALYINGKSETLN